MERGTQRILLLGADGQVGWELRRSLATVGEVFAATRADADLRDAAALRDLFHRLTPAAVVNAAAWTDVDGAESSPEAAFAINATAPGILAELCARRGALLVHYSTDYVFDGTSTRPYTETDETSPLSVYGESKRDGELAIARAGCAAIVLRTSWVYGLRGRNFLRTIVRLATERDELRIVADQIGAPTWSRAIAEATAEILTRCSGENGFVPPPEKQGIFHLTAAGATSWHGFASAILEGWPDPAVRNRRIVAIPTDEFPRPARRPAYSVLDNARIAERFGIRLHPWREQLANALAEVAGVNHSAAALNEP